MTAQQLIFEDMMVGSTVARDDEERLSRQNNLMLRYFVWCRRRNRPISTTELLRFGCQYQSRLFDVRRHLIPRGFCIDRSSGRKGTGIHFYRMVPLDESEWYAKRKDRL